jgi:TP901 family phage tail tape measure protein
MATTALTVKTSFTAVDKFTATIKKMTAGVRTFGKSAVATFHKVDRAQRRFQNNISKSIGQLGRLGLAFSGAALAATILAANVELDKNLASLSAITGVTGDEFNKFKTQIEAVSKSQKKFSGETAKAFEIVGSAKPELLGNAEALGKVTEASIILSKATGADLAKSAEDLTGTLNQFSLSADESSRVMNVLAAGSQAGSAPVDQITESLKQFGTIAGSSNISVEESVGLIETLSEKFIKGGEAGTKLRNIITKMNTIKVLPKNAQIQLKKFGVNFDIVSDKTVPLQKRLEELSKIVGDSTALAQVFGAENLVAGQVLLENTKKVENYTKAVTGTNTAVEQANINSFTLANLWEELVSSFKNAVTTTNSENKALNVLKNALAFAADNMDTLITALTIITAVLGTFKLVMAAVNFVMAASPITWITLGIVLLIAAVAALVIWWEEIVNWVKTSDNAFAKLIRFVLNPLMWLFRKIGEIIEWLVEKWEKLVDWIKNSDSTGAKFIRGTLNGLVNAFTKIGEIIAWVTDKWVKLNEFIGGVRESIAEYAVEQGALKFLSPEDQKLLAAEAFATELQARKNRGETSQNLNPDATSAETINNTITTNNNNQNLAIDINDPGNNANVTKKPGSVIKLTKTVGFAQ